MSAWLEAAAPAKLNLALVVGPLRADGKHEVVTVLQRVSLADAVAVRRANSTEVMGFEDDTLVRSALEAVGDAADGEPRFEARIEKRIPVAAGLGGGSSNAATALKLANELLGTRLTDEALHRLAVRLGSDVPFFLRPGPQLATGDGTCLEPVELPSDYEIVLALPAGEKKASTRAVYEAFDRRAGALGYDERSAELRAALGRVRTSEDLAQLPPNDLASSPLAAELRELGAFRADVTGAGPVVFGLFSSSPAAQDAVAALDGRAATWAARPA
jgi:4-diphosphocytidyl-2-C-methyl-D-erythritol kinase